MSFLGCDSLIAETFKHAMNSPERRFSVNYFPETTKSAIDLYVTFGQIGDNIWQSAHFEKTGEFCYSVVRSVISQQGNCAGILSRDEYFKYMADSAGALWAENKGGVTKVLMQSGATCNQIYMNSNKQKASN